MFPEEPTSTVAFFLTSPAYHEQLDRMRADHRAATSSPGEGATGTHTHTSSRSDMAFGTPRSSVADVGTPPCHTPSRSTTMDLGADGSFVLDAMQGGAGSAAFPGDSRTGGASTLSGGNASGSGGADGVESEVSRGGPYDDLSMLRSSVKKSLTLEFTAASQPNTPERPMRFTVVAYYALQFAELRRRLVAGGELSFLLSLSRCKRWRPKGGKTMAYFAKTFDERYIIKSLSRSEKVWHHLRWTRCWRVMRFVLCGDTA